jgi:hypothetical protein
MANVKMTLLVPTFGKKAGDAIEVADAETADRLEASRSAVRASSAKSTKD